MYKIYLCGIFAGSLWITIFGSVLIAAIIVFILQRLHELFSKPFYKKNLPFTNIFFDTFAMIIVQPVPKEQDSPTWKVIKIIFINYLLLKNHFPLIWRKMIRSNNVFVFKSDMYP